MKSLLEQYKATFVNDLLASVVVFLVALPLCMGIAIASGAPPALGLMTGVIGGIIVGILAGSPLQVSGPAAGLAVICWELIQKYGLEMMGIIVLLAGLIQLAAGLLKWGRYFRAISPPVIYGMLAGIGVLIFAGQFHVMLDDKPRGSGLLNIVSIPETLYKGIFPLDGSSHHFAAMLGLLTIVIIVAWGRFKPAALRFVPAPLVAAGAATVVAYVWKFPVQFINVPANLLDAAIWPTPERLARMLEPGVLSSGLAVALIASAETLLCAIAVDRMHNGPRTNFDKELAAQGVGNILCGMLGALPMTGVIVRSTANIESGAKTRVSAIIHGVWLVVLVAAAPGLLRLIPTSSLAAILVYTGYKLVNPANVRALAAYGRAPLFIYFATIVAIVATDLLKGVIFGVVLSLIRLIYNLTHLELRLTADPARRRADLYLNGSATFVSLPRLAETLESLPPGTELHLHVDKLVHIDHACLDCLHAWEAHQRPSGSRLVVEWDDLTARYERPALAK